MTYGTLLCNLCWQELQPPFIVTACNHMFCMSHQDDERVLAKTCPGCNSHLKSSGGLRVAHYEVKKMEDLSVLNGLKPDQVLKIASNAMCADAHTCSQTEASHMCQGHRARTWLGRVQSASRSATTLTTHAS